MYICLFSTRLSYGCWNISVGVKYYCTNWIPLMLCNTTKVLVIIFLIITNIFLSGDNTWKLLNMLTLAVSRAIEYRHRLACGLRDTKLITINHVWNSKGYSHRSVDDVRGLAAVVGLSKVTKRFRRAASFSQYAGSGRVVQYQLVCGQTLGVEQLVTLLRNDT